MLGTFHYHGLIRKYIAVFGTLFNDITIKRIDNSNNIKETIKVPLSYGPKQKFLVRITQESNINRNVAITLPRIGFEMTSMSYDPERKLNSLNAKVVQRDGSIGRMYAPVPYNLSFSVNVFVKNAVDGAMIVEQILPAFKPDFTVTINAIPTMDIKIDMPITLQSVSVEDSYEGDFTTRRAIVYTLDFESKVYFYPNIKGRGFGDYSEEDGLGLIRTAITNFHILSGDQIAKILDHVILETSTETDINYILMETGTDKIIDESSSKGLDKSKVISAIKNSVPQSTNINDVFDSTSIVEDYNFYIDGKEYDPITGNYT